MVSVFLVCVLCCGLFLFREDQGSFAIASSEEDLLPPTGFVTAQTNIGQILLRIIAKQLPASQSSKSIVLCPYLTIKNQPKPNNSPLVGPNIFTLNTQSTVAGHFVWTNGNESIFFVPSVHSGGGGGGNWLFGFELGVDNGYIYLESSEETLSPLEILPGKGWKWLQDNRWAEQPQMKLECVIEGRHRDHLLSRSLSPFIHSSPENIQEKLPVYETSHFYRAEFFHPTEQALFSSFVFPDFPAVELSFAVSGEGVNENQSAAYGILNLETLEFINVNEIELLAAFGHLHVINTKANDKYVEGSSSSSSSAPTSRHSKETSATPLVDGSLTEYAILLNVEQGNEQNWRITFRVVNQYLPKRNTTVYAHSTHSALSIPDNAFAEVNPASREFFQTFMQGFGDPDHPFHNPDAMEGLPLLPADDMYYDYYFPGKWSKVRDQTKINRVLALKEYRVELGNEGIMKINEAVIHRIPSKNKHFYEISPLLPQSSPASESESTVSDAESPKPLRWKDWETFYSDEMLVDLQIGDYLWLWYTTNSSVSVTEELLVKLVYDHDSNYYIFEVYPTNRLDQMQQTILSKNKDFLVLQRRNSTISKHKHSILSASLAGQNIAVHSIIEIPKPHIARFLLNYLLVKEKDLSLSTCFFYHAAVTIPQSLIYAAEILCVVIGSKPIVMIQFTSPSEHQWKFPLVQELSQALLSLQYLKQQVKQLPSPLSPHDRIIKSLVINSTVFTYNHDETLVFYHNDASLLLQSLLPVNQTQALHPLPYELPETATDAEKDKNWKEQIFNAAWNGFILGYPTYFVQRYCEDYHNPLDRLVKFRVYEKALKKFNKFVKKSGFYEMSKHFKYIEKPEVQFGFHSPMNKYLLAVLLHKVVQSL